MNVHVVAIIPGRVRSTRLPGDILLTRDVCQRELKEG